MVEFYDETDRIKNFAGKIYDFLANNGIIVIGRAEIFANKLFEYKSLNSGQIILKDEFSSST